MAWIFDRSVSSACIAAGALVAGPSRSDTHASLRSERWPGPDRGRPRFDDDALDLVVDLLPYTSAYRWRRRSRTTIAKRSCCSSRAGSSGSGGIALVEQITGAQRDTPSSAAARVRAGRDQRRASVRSSPCNRRRRPSRACSGRSTHRAGDYTAFPLVSDTRARARSRRRGFGRRAAARRVAVVGHASDPANRSEHRCRDSRLTVGGSLNLIGTGAALSAGIDVRLRLHRGNTPNVILEVDLATGAQRVVTIGRSARRGHRQPTRRLCTREYECALRDGS